MGFAFCIAYLVFLIIYFQEYENKQEITQYSNLREMQLQSMQNEIEQVKISSQKLAILRHDMRHHLSIILTQLQNGHPDKAQEYIHEINSAYDDTIIAAYSGNEMLKTLCFPFIIPVSQTEDCLLYAMFLQEKNFHAPICPSVQSCPMRWKTPCMHWSSWNHLQNGPGLLFRRKRITFFSNWKIP